jgi:hypothetical protein
MEFRFTLKNGKAGRLLAVLTVALEEDVIEHGITAAIKDQFAAHLQTECARRGIAGPGEVHVEIQDNFLTHGVDVTATAFVQARKGGSKRKPPVRMRVAKVRKAIKSIMKTA